MSLTPLFSAPQRAGRDPSTLVCRCSCGSISEIYKQYFRGPKLEDLTPEQAASGRYKPRKDKCINCDSDAARKNAQDRYNVALQKHDSYGRRINRNQNRPTNAAQAAYFAVAPDALTPGFLTFLPGAYEAAISGVTTKEDRIIAQAISMLHQRVSGMKHSPLLDLSLASLADAVDRLPHIPAFMPPPHLRIPAQTL